jgi:hypothetical protein
VYTLCQRTIGVVHLRDLGQQILPPCLAVLAALELLDPFAGRGLLGITEAG